MAAVSMTAADVRPLPGAITRRFTAGGTINAGQPVYLNSSGNAVRSDATDRAKSHVVGLAVADNDGGTIFSSGDIIDVVVFGPVAGGSSLNEGSFAYCGTTAGGMEDGSPGSGNYKVIVGVPHADDILFVNPIPDSADTQLTS